MAGKTSKAKTQMRNTTAHEIRVTLQLAGRMDRETHGIAGRLFASIGASSPTATPTTVVALIHLDLATGKVHIGDLRCPDWVPREVMERLKLAITEAWKTAKFVDLVDEQGRPLLLGSIHAHPAGVTRWLRQHCQDRC